MQMVFLAALLWLSAQILTLLLAQFVTRPTIGPVLAVYCTFVTFWQLTYVYRMLAMKRAVLLDPTVPTGLRIAMATTLVPSREFDLLRDKLEGMMHVDTCGNRIDHWVLDEEDDPRVRVLIGHLNQQYQHRGVHILHFTARASSATTRRLRVDTSSASRPGKRAATSMPGSTRHGMKATT
jgi:hypothetical protein